MALPNRISFLLILMLVMMKDSFGQNPIAYYPFNNNTIDLSGNNNNGTISGGVTATTDRFGNPCGALNFNGTDGYIEVPNSSSLQSIDKVFSVAVWFKIQYVPGANGFRWLTIICKGGILKESPENPQYRFQTFQSNNQSTISINTDFTEFDKDFRSHILEYDKWNFYVMVYDGKDVNCYLNNNIIWSFPYKKSLHVNDDPLHIGKDIPGSIEHFIGAMDDLRIYDVALSENKISELYNDNSGASFSDGFDLRCSGDIVAYAEKDACYAVVNFPDPELKITCSNAILTQISGLKSGSEFPVGLSTATFEAVSISGAKKTCNINITVIDDLSPVIKCQNDTTIFITDANENSKLYEYPMPMVLDNCSDVTVKLVKGLSSGRKFPIGLNVLRFQASDKSGNISECSYRVYVKKNVKSDSTVKRDTLTKPVTNVKPDSILKRDTIEKPATIVKRDSLVCPEDIRKVNDSHQCGAVINFTLNQNETEIKQIEGLKSGTMFPVGNTANRYENNTSTTNCLFNVTVVDVEKPELECPNDIIVYAPSRGSATKVNYPFPKAKDNCGIASVSQLIGNKSDDLFPAGNTQNVFKAVDIYGNYTTCTFNVVVIDTFKVPRRDAPAEIGFKPDLIPDSIRYYKGALAFNACVITVVLYDDNQEDDDTISVFFNNREIVSREKIRNKQNGTIVKALTLHPGEKNVFIVKAWNNGRVSPNTLQIDFYEGDYLEKQNRLKNKKPILEKTMYSKPGVASAIYLNCANK